MFVQRIEAAELSERIDPEYFSPAFVCADRLLAEAERRGVTRATINSLRAADSLVCYGVLQPLFVENGVPEIEISDLEGGVLFTPDRAITQEQHQEYRRSAVLPGDVLISV